MSRGERRRIARYVWWRLLVLWLLIILPGCVMARRHPDAVWGIGLLTLLAAAGAAHRIGANAVRRRTGSRRTATR